MLHADVSCAATGNNLRQFLPGYTRTGTNNPVVPAKENLMEEW